MSSHNLGQGEYYARMIRCPGEPSLQAIAHCQETALPRFPNSKCRITLRRSRRILCNLKAG